MDIITVSKKITINKLPNIYQNSNNLLYIKEYCNLLEQLNSILKSSIPEYMANICHFGAIDNDKNIIVLFVDNQQIFHYIRSISEHILQNLTKNGFYYDGLLIKIKQRQQEKIVKNQVKITKERYLRLEKFAKLIDRPDLLISIEEKNSDEFDI
jgi:hypothetical protein